MKKNIIFASLFIAIGITAIVLGAVCLARINFWTYVSGKTYGADFYTDTQNSVAAIANNVGRLIGVCARGFDYILLIAGCVLIAKGVKDIVCYKNKEN